MQLLKNIEAIDLAVLIDKSILVIADIHIGYEEALNKQGILIPRFQFRDIVERLTNILEKTKPSKIIINGDLKHEFGTISEQEWRDTLRILNLMEKYTKDILLIKGNHDKILGPIAKKRNIKVLDSYEIPELSLCICHGDKIVKTDMKSLIIAHEHPAIRLREHLKSELYKCFLKGSYGKGKSRKTLIVQPSLSLVSEGTDIAKERLLSPYLQQSLGNFEVFIVGRPFEVLNFGKINKLAKIRESK